MAIYKEKAIECLLNIFNYLYYRLLFSREFSHQYIDDMIDYYESKPENYLKEAEYKDHKKYGKYVYRYDRNQRTQWYACYDFDKRKKIMSVNYITNNHLTIVGV